MGEYGNHAALGRWKSVMSNRDTIAVLKDRVRNAEATILFMGAWYRLAVRGDDESGTRIEEYGQQQSSKQQRRQRTSQAHQQANLRHSHRERQQQLEPSFCEKEGTFWDASLPSPRPLGTLLRDHAVEEKKYGEGKNRIFSHDWSENDRRDNRRSQLRSQPGESRRTILLHSRWREGVVVRVQQHMVHVLCEIMQLREEMYLALLTKEVKLHLLGLDDELHLCDLLEDFFGSETQRRLDSSLALQGLAIV